MNLTTSDAGHALIGIVVGRRIVGNPPLNPHAYGRAAIKESRHRNLRLGASADYSTLAPTAARDRVRRLGSKLGQWKIQIRTMASELGHYPPGRYVKATARSS
jgi:hypothetical protein